MTALDTRTKLMDAAEYAVRSNGADGFSYADLADDIGIRKASIHYHFPTKSDLLTAIMARYAAGVLDALENVDATRPDGNDRLLAFLDIYRGALNTGDTLCLCVAYAVSQNGLAETTRTEIAQFRASVLNWLNSTLVESDLEEDAAAVLALVEGAQIAARFARDISVFDTATQSTRTRLKSGG